MITPHDDKNVDLGILKDNADKMYNALCALWNAVYNDKHIYNTYQEWSESGAYPITIEMITRNLPDNLRQAMITSYDVIHAYKKG